MSDYLVGVVLLAAALAPLSCAAVSLRRRLVPNWPPMPARLAEALIVLMLLLGVLHALGSVGLFRRVPVVLACIAVGSVVAWRCRAPVPKLVRERRAPAIARWETLLSIAVTLVVVGEWLPRTNAAFSEGISDPDSLWYHLPHAARFVQLGWITRLHYTAPEFPSAFHPGDSELLHGLGMMLFRTDALSPALNLGWLALALVAAWCIGQTRGRGPLALTLVGLILVTPEMVAQSGTGLNDVATLSLLLVVAALLLQPRDNDGALTLAAAAAGVAIGVKLTMIAPVAALSVGVVLTARSGTRLRAAVRWLIPLAATGSFWYLRNLARAGNPIPSLHFPGLPTPRFATVDELGFSVAHYLTDSTVIRHYFVPGLTTGFGPGWVMLIVGAVVALALAFRHGPAIERVLAFTALVGAASYVITPTSALGPDGRPDLFVANLRYVVPPLALALVMLSIGVRDQEKRSRSFSITSVLLTAGAAGVFAMQHVRPDGLSFSFTHGARIVVALGVLSLGTLLMVLATLSFEARVTRAGVVALSVVGLIALGLVASRRLESGRYPAERWADSVTEPIGVAGTARQFPYYGSAAANVVQYIGSVGPHGEFHEIRTCADWRAAVHDGGFGYVVLSTDLPGGHPELEWTNTDPGARVFLSTGSTTVFAIDHQSVTAPCPAGSAVRR